jgi:hypothetical protein
MRQCTFFVGVTARMPYTPSARALVPQSTHLQLNSHGRLVCAPEAEVLDTPAGVGGANSFTPTALISQILASRLGAGLHFPDAIQATCRFTSAFIAYQRWGVPD